MGGCWANLEQWRSITFQVRYGKLFAVRRVTFVMLQSRHSGSAAYWSLFAEFISRADSKHVWVDSMLGGIQEGFQITWPSLSLFPSFLQSSFYLFLFLLVIRPFFLSVSSQTSHICGYGLDGSGIESRLGEIFSTRSNWSWWPLSLLHSEYRVSNPGLKRPGRGVNHPPLSSAEVKERVELYRYSHSGPSWPVLGRTCSNFGIGLVRKVQPYLKNFWNIVNKNLVTK